MQKEGHIHRKEEEGKEEEVEEKYPEKKTKRPIAMGSTHVQYDENRKVPQNTTMKFSSWE